MVRYSTRGFLYGFDIRIALKFRFGSDLQVTAAPNLAQEHYYFFSSFYTHELQAGSVESITSFLFFFFP